MANEQWPRGLRFWARFGGAPALRSAVADDGALEAWVYSPIVRDEDEAAMFGGVSAEAFVSAVRGFRGPEIRVYINSPGGDYFGGVAMAEALRQTGARVVALVDGVAASAASLLLTAAAERRIAPAGRVMVHRAWTLEVGNADDFLRSASVLEGIDRDIARAYAARSPRGPDAWLEMMAAETWFSAAEAVNAGLADNVFRVDNFPKSQDMSACAAGPAPDVAAPGTRDVAAARLRVRAALVGVVRNGNRQAEARA